MAASKVLPDARTSARVDSSGSESATESKATPEEASSKAALASKAARRDGEDSAYVTDLMPPLSPEASSTSFLATTSPAPPTTSTLSKVRVQSKRRSTSLWAISFCSLSSYLPSLATRSLCSSLREESNTETLE